MGHLSSRTAIASYKEGAGSSGSSEEGGETHKDLENKIITLDHLAVSHLHVSCLSLNGKLKLSTAYYYFILHIFLF